MAIARSSITIIRRWCWCWDILRPADRIVFLLLTFHIILRHYVPLIPFIVLVLFLVIFALAVS